PAVAALLVVSVLAAMALAAGSVGLFYTGRLKAALAEAHRQRGEADAQRALARRYLYLAHLSLADQAWQKGHPARVRHPLDQYQRVQPGQEDLRQFEWHYLWRQSLPRDRLTLKGHREAVTAVAFAPDGKRLASASQDRTIKIVAIQTGKELLTLTGHKGN